MTEEFKKNFSVIFFMINVHIKDLKISIKPSSTNGTGCFLQGITNLVSIFSEALCTFLEEVTYSNVASYFIIDLRKHLNDIYIEVYMHIHV